MVKLTQRVEVYDKAKRRIAIFTPGASTSGVDGTEAMINPTIEIEQNGNSSFEFSMDITSEKWNIIKDPENTYIVDGREFTPLNEGAYTFVGNIVAVLCVESWYLLDKAYVQAYNVDKELEGIDEHTVCILPKSTQPLVVNGKQYDDCPYPRGSAGYALWAILKDSGWSLGTCDVIVDGFSPADDFGVFNVESDMESILENVKLVQELYGGILVWDSVHHRLDLRDENKWNTDTGFEARVGKNLKENPEIVQSNDIITKLYPFGESYLNIKAVNDGKTYVENHSYTEKVYSRILQNSDIYDQKQLKFWGEKELAKICRPTRTVTMEIIDRRLEPGFETDEFDLNSIVTIYYDTPEGEHTSEKQRIIKWKYNVFNPEDAEIECGNKDRNVIEMLKQSFDMGSEASSKFNSNGYVSSGYVYVPDYYGGSYGWGGGSLSNYLVNNEQEIDLVVEKITDTSDALAAFQLYADETFATIEALVSYQTETTEAIADLKLYADGQFASAELVASYKRQSDAADKQLNESLAALRLYADGISATAALVTKVVDNSGNIKAASIVAAVNASGSSVKITADHIALDGVTNFLNSNSPGGGGSIKWEGNNLRLGSTGSITIHGYSGITMEGFVTFLNGVRFKNTVNSTSHRGTDVTVSYKKSSGATGSLYFEQGILYRAT